MARPDLGKKWNYVIDVWMDGCDAPFSGWFEAAKPAVLTAVVSYYCLDPVQMFTAYVRPAGPFKGYRGGSHGRGSSKGKRPSGMWGRFKKAFGFDPSDWLGRQMPMAEEMQGRQVPGGARYGWALFGAIERANNFVFMYDLVENAFYETAMGVARSTYCSAQRAASFVGTTDGQGNLPLLEMTPAVIGSIDKARHMIYVAGNRATPEGDYCNAFFSLKDCRPSVTGEEIVNGYLTIIADTGQVSRARVPSNGGTVAVSLSTNEPSGFLFFLEGDNFWSGDDAQFIVTGRPREPGEREPGWCNDLVNTAINWAS